MTATALLPTCSPRRGSWERRPGGGIVLATLVVASHLLMGGCAGRRSAPTLIQRPVWSPVSLHIAFVACAEGLTDATVCVVGADGHALRVLHRGGIATGGPAWSPDGQAIAVGLLTEDTARALVMPAHTRGRPRVLAKARIGYAGDPDWSRDGARLVWVGLSRADEGLLLVTEGSTGAVRPLRLEVSPELPQWSPTGEWISFAAMPPKGEPRRTMALYVVSSDGRTERRVACPGRMQRVWLDSNTILHFTRGRQEPTCRFYQTNVLTGERTLVMSTDLLPPGFDGDMRPQWDQRHRRVVLVARNAKKAAQRSDAPRGSHAQGDLYCVDLDRKSVVQLTELGVDCDPAWSADGQYISFVRDGNSLWTMNADGSCQRRILTASQVAP